MVIENTYAIKELIIKGNSNSPSITLNKNKNIFEFSGISIPDDVNSVYSPVIQWLEEYKGIPNPVSEIVFKMDFINPDSSRMLEKIFDIFQEMYKNGNKIKIVWYYHFDDEDMRIEGRNYSNLYSLPFELINYS